MTELLIFIMSSVGLSIMLTKSSLFLPAREFIDKTYTYGEANHKTKPSAKHWIVWKTFWFLKALSLCNLCMGFWTGMFIYLVRYQELSTEIFIFGLISSIASLTYAELQEYVKRH